MAKRRTILFIIGNNNSQKEGLHWEGGRLDDLTALGLHMMCRSYAKGRKQ